MSRVLNVVRLQLINKQTFIWIPLIVLAGAVLISVTIYAMIPVDTPKYGGGAQAPLWYFLAVGISALTYTFPFSQAMSVTRREFFLGTMVAAAMASLAMSVIFVLGGLFELATNGWWVNGYLFHLPWVWEAGSLGAGLVFFTLSMFLFLLGFTATTIFKTWGPTTLTIIGLVLALLLVGAIFLITRMELWVPLFESVAEMGAVGLAAWGLVVTAVLGVFSFLAVRRAKP